ncbi:MAG: DUF4268 domain-containing protein [Chloroflexi bacterium]|nr:DUF4268 domain-containing protein [Chloroflexota bacterium]MCI0645978.1 DUF4268 domain-containing protein [Chloroflexota bacterium]MCI0727290.1 DUF4268 domain-containing protein [Chloroflexota bacterium]
MLDAIGELLERQGLLLCVKRTETVRDALVKMVDKDFSQLPIVDEGGYLTGIISEQTITRHYYHLNDMVSLLDLTVDHCQEEAVTLSEEDSSLFAILERLESNYAVVITSERKPIGIVTDYDTTHFFRAWSEGLMRVQSIELTLRKYIEDVLTTEQAMTAALLQALGADKTDPSKPRKTYDDLTFYEHIQLMTHEKVWPKFEPYLTPKKLFSQLMEAVNQVRNQLAHFRGRLDSIQYDALKRSQRWLATRPKVPQAMKTVPPFDVPVPPSAATGKYAPLQDWLAAQARQITPGYDIQRTFNDIQALIGDQLPDAAREHRAWWANDATSPYRQSMAWLRAGWKVENVDFAAETVVFRRTDTVLYQLFFADLLERLKAEHPGITRAARTYPQNFWSFGAGRSGFFFTWTFTENHYLRVSLDIATVDHDTNKNVFALLQSQKAEIERQIGAELQWERLDEHRSSRISLAIKARINDSPERLELAKEWCLNTTIRFVDVFQPKLKELHFEQ